MLPMNELRRVYDEYLSDAARLSSTYKPTDGLLGFGRGPGSDPCHDRFQERLERALAVTAEAAPPSSVVAEVLSFIYEAPLRHQNNTMVSLMLKAVHTLTEPLVTLLSQEDAATLWTRYDEAYPRAERLPVQKKIAALLRERAGDAMPRTKRTLLDILRGRGR